MSSNLELSMRPLQRNLLFAACLLPATALAQSSEPPKMFTPEWNARLRTELVDDDAFPNDSDATTLRLRLGVRGRFGDHFTALLEGEGIAATGDYDSTANGRRGYPVIADD